MLEQTSTFGYEDGSSKVFQNIITQCHNSQDHNLTVVHNLAYGGDNCLNVKL